MAADFLSGMIAMGSLMAAVFFFRFWSRTGDALFLAFGSAFVLLAANQGILSLAVISRENESWVYLLRLIAFCLIIGAITIKNTETRTRV